MIEFLHSGGGWACIVGAFILLGSLLLAWFMCQELGRQSRNEEEQEMLRWLKAHEKEFEEWLNK